MICISFLFIYFVLTYVLYMRRFPACCFRQRTYMAQGLVNGVLNKIWTHSCSQFECFSFGYGFYIEDFLSFSLSVFTLDCLTFIWYVYVVCVCVCVCALQWFGVLLTVIFLLCVWVCVLGIFLCMCGSVVLNLLVIFFSNSFLSVYMYTHICVCMCVCVCVCLCVCFLLNAFIREHVWCKV